ncbi:MAG: hypothetical protein IKQ45_06445 [Clostridia bacterium]|nr:hypothetical protein [Clostridia bacterium]
MDGNQKQMLNEEDLDKVSGGSNDPMDNPLKEILKDSIKRSLPMYCPICEEKDAVYEMISWFGSNEAKFLHSGCNGCFFCDTLGNIHFE